MDTLLKFLIFEHELRVLDCSGTYHTMKVIKKTALNLNIPMVSGEVLEP